RIWSARTTPENVPAYSTHLKSHVLPRLREVDGYAGATLLERKDKENVEVMVITYWRSMDAIRGFASANLEKAVVAQEAAALLTDFDERVRHYEVAMRDEL